MTFPILFANKNIGEKYFYFLLTNKLFHSSMYSDNIFGGSYTKNITATKRKRQFCTIVTECAAVDNKKEIPLA